MVIGHTRGSSASLIAVVIASGASCGIVIGDSLARRVDGIWFGLFPMFVFLAFGAWRASTMVDIVVYDGSNVFMRTVLDKVIGRGVRQISKSSISVSDSGDCGHVVCGRRSYSFTVVRLS